MEARAATLASNESDNPVCHRSTPELGGLQWFTGLLYHHERPRLGRGSLTAAWCNAQRTIGEAGSLWSLHVVCVIVHDTVASLSVLNDINVLYTCIRDTLISHTRSDIYIWFSQRGSRPDLRHLVRKPVAVTQTQVGSESVTS